MLPSMPRQIRSLGRFARSSSSTASPSTLYVDDTTLAFYEDEDHMLAHFGQLHSYVYLDLAKIDLFTTELFPVAERVEYITTAMDFFMIVRIYHGDEGLFLALDHDEPVEPLVAAVFEAIGDGSAE